MLQKQHPEKLYFCQKANIKIRLSTRESSRDTGERAIKNLSASYSLGTSPKGRGYASVHSLIVILLNTTRLLLFLDAKGYFALCGARQGRCPLTPQVFEKT